MIKTPYDTTACRHFPLADIRNALARAAAAGEITRQDESASGIYVVTGLKTTGVRIPPFGHPVHFEDAYGKTHIAIDARAYALVRQDGNSEVKVRNTMEYGLLTHRAFLQKAWDAEHYGDLRNISSISLGLYSRWISEGLARQFQLQPDVQLKLALLSAYFFLCQFIPKGAFDPKETDKRAAMISRVVSMNVGDVEKFIKDLPHIEDLGEFCDEIVKLNLSIRLEKLDPAILITVMANSWTGSQTRELVAVALEHPPTFIPMIYQAMVEHGLRKTRLADLILRAYSKGDLPKQFVYNYSKCIEVWRGV